MFKKNHITLLHQCTKGNLRTINKVMYKLFEIYEYYEANKPSLVGGKHAKMKFIEMAIIDAGLLDA